MRPLRLRPRHRRGNILVLSACFMIGMIALAAMAVDIGYVFLARTELQRSADAAAIAAAWELIEEAGTQETPNTREMASRFAELNTQAKQELTLGENDVVVGQLEELTPTADMTFDVPQKYNAVQVDVRKADQQNGEVPFFFAKALGVVSSEVRATATAGFLNNIHGFRAPSSGENRNLDILPFALDQQTWTNLVSGYVAADLWSWNKETDEVEPGQDGEYEVNLFPQGTGSPGNRGTVDIGGSNNSTADIARQIVHGISPEDLTHHGGELNLDEEHSMELNGDTGISAGVKDELASIIGETRIIPIFSQVAGPGNNAQYTIVKWMGVRIMDVKLTGPMNKKRLTIQPAKVVTRGAIPASPADPQTSESVFSWPRLVR